MDRLTRAYETRDMEGLVALLADDVLMAMPPVPLEYLGRALAARFLRAASSVPVSKSRPIPTRANGQPALSGHVPSHAARRQLPPGLGVMVLTLAGSRVSAITRFAAPALLPRFGFPATLPG